MDYRPAWQGKACQTLVFSVLVIWAGLRPNLIVDINGSKGMTTVSRASLFRIAMNSQTVQVQLLLVVCQVLQQLCALSNA
jgi:hypothetical protein